MAPPARQPSVKVHPEAGEGRGEDAQDTVRDDIVYYSLRPLWFAMQACGFFPVHRHCRGARVKEPSAGSVVCGVQYAAVLALMGWAYACMLTDQPDQAPVDFDGTVINYLVYIQCALPMVILPCYAARRKQMQAYLRDWNTLQVQFARGAGRSMSMPSLRSSRPSYEVLAGVALWLLVVAGVQVPLQPAAVVAALLLSNLVSALLAGSWALHGAALRRAARVLRTQLRHELVSSGPSPSPRLVDAARVQMVRLLELVRQLGDSQSLPIGLLLLFHFVLQTLSLYALFGQLTSSRSEAWTARLLCITAGVVASGMVVYVCCNTGHQVTAEIKTSSVDEILAYRWRTPVIGHHLHQMLEAFIATTHEIPSAVTLAGIATIDRGLFTAILSTMVTYLVVVVQFRISLLARQEDGRSHEPWPPTNSTATILRA